MSDAGSWREVEQRIAKVVKGSVRPVGVAFLDHEPTGIKKIEGTQPSSCSFWRLAAEGRTFYTLPENHFNCAVGAYTHNIPLSPEREKETGDTLKMMFDLGYVRPEEVPQIPRLAKTPKAIVYSPLGEMPVDPDVVLFALKPSAAMLLQEAAGRAGVGTGAPALGRPTCMAIPAAMSHGAVASTGCIGNRIYTDIGEDELYVTLRGQDLERIAAELDTIANANTTLTGYHQERRARLTA